VSIALLNYVFVFFAILITLVLFVVDLGLTILALRIGLAGRMLVPTRAVYILLAKLIKSLKLDQDVDCHVQVPRSVAPRLYDMAKRLADKIGVDPPSEIVFEMENNASVLLHGYKTGKGNTRLVIGFDTLAILSEGEFEALLAHELAHARLVQRGFNSIILKGVQRCIQMAQGLGGICESVREEKKRFYLAEFLENTARQLSKSAVRIVSSYRRQDEFAADQLAAEICGPGACKSMLHAIVIANVKGYDLTLRERLMHLERDESFTDWLYTRLTPASDEERAELEIKGIDKRERSEYDSHPVPADRFAMWGEASYSPENDNPAIHLIKDPDYIARKLTDEIERIISEAEREDTNRLQKWTSKKPLGRVKFTGGQTLCLFLGIFIFAAVILYGVNGYAIGTVISLALLVACVLAYRKVGYKDPISLPFPEYGVLRKFMYEERSPEDANDEVLERKLAEQSRTLGLNKKSVAQYWANRAYTALKECDYKTAVVASRLGISADPKSDELLLAHGIAEAYFGNMEASDKSINTIYGRRNLVSTITWGFGWVFVLQGKWSAAEIYLLDAANYYLNEPTVLALLGRCQWERGKLNEALQNIRRAVDLKPDDYSLRLSLAKVLLEMERAKAAREQIEIMEKEQPEDYDLMACACLAAVKLGHTDEADKRADELLETHPGPKTLAALGGMYMDVEENEKARHYLEAVLENGHSPSSLTSLAYIEFQKNNKEGARKRLLEALDCCREPLPDSAPVEDLFSTIFPGLVACDDNELTCQSWISRIPMDDSPIKQPKISFLVVAPALQQAQDYVAHIYKAMHPDRDLDLAKTQWELAPKEDQPEKPITPGIYGYVPEE